MGRGSRSMRSSSRETVTESVEDQAEDIGQEQETDSGVETEDQGWDQQVTHVFLPLQTLSTSLPNSIIFIYI